VTTPFNHNTQQNEVGNEFEYVITKNIENINKYITYITIFAGAPKLDYVDVEMTNYTNKYYGIV